MGKDMIETAADVFARHLKCGTTFVSPFGLAMIYTGIHEDGHGYVVVTDMDNTCRITIAKTVADPERLAGTMMGMLDLGIVVDWITTQKSINSIVA
jgi:hypothetical protein